MVILEDVRQTVLCALADSDTGVGWLELPAAVKVTEADVRAIALIQFAMELYPEMELGDFHRLLYDARWWATLLVASQPSLDDPVQYPNMHLAQRILDEAEGGSSAD